MAHVVAVRRARRSAEQWRAILAEWSGSGLSQAEFCRRRGFSKVTFNGWKRRLGAAALRSSCPRHGAVPRGVSEQRGAWPVGAARSPFVELAGPPRVAEPAVYEVRLANGRAVRVGPEFDPATLRRLLALVDVSGVAVAADEPAGRGC
jgi:hypothetical protein